LTTSKILFFVKILFGIAATSLFIYYAYNELFDDTHGVVVALISGLFLSGGDQYAMIAMIIGLFSVAFMCTLRVYVPLQYLALIGVNFIVLLYSLILTIAIFPHVDHVAFTVYICLLYLLWYPWARRLRI
jgi:hypothetical protein